MKTVAVIFGGQSQEHEVSCRSALAVLNNLDRTEYTPVRFGINKEGHWLLYEGSDQDITNGQWQEKADSHGIGIFAEMCSEGQIDVVFPVLHGPNGEDGTIQGFFEMLDIPYVGCGVLSSSASMDKVYTKTIVSTTNVPQCKFVSVRRVELATDADEVYDAIEEQLGFPCFVKPANAGSSVGISKVEDRSGLSEALQTALVYDSKAIVEEFVKGSEIECAVLGNDAPRASGVGEVVPCNDFYDYDAKYNRGDDSRISIPADLAPELVQRIREYAVTVYKAMDCSGLSRIDFFCDKETGNIVFNELNTLPGFTIISMYAKLWAQEGVTFDQLVSQLIDLAFERHSSRRRKY